MNDVKEWKEKALRYIKQEGNTRPVSFYELNSQMLGNSNILSILQELVAEDFILEQKIEINGLSLDIPLDTVTLYFNKIKSEKDKVSAPILRCSILEESCLKTSSKSVDLNSQIQSHKNQLLELNNVEIDLKKKLHNLDIQRTLNDHYRKLHEYNEIKDIGQMLLGKCAEIEGTTTKEMYKKFEVELND